MSVTKQQVSALYIAVYGRAPEASGLKFWSEEFTGSYADAAAAFVTHPLFAQEYAELSNQEIVEKFYTNILGAEGDTAGIEYWVERLENGEDMNVVLSEFLNISLTGDFTGDEAAQARQATLVNKAEVAVYYAEKMGEASEFPEGTDLNSVDVANADAFKKAAEAIANVNASAASVAAAKAAIDAAAPNPEEPEVPGKTFFLTEGADRDVDAADGFLKGTDGNDTFIADVIQTNGVQVNTLGSGDRLDGGKGNDTLLAEVAGGNHVSGGTQQIQPKTQDIEIVKLQAVASGLKNGGDVVNDNVVVSAKDMVGVNYIGSNYSDANLIITDVNTKATQDYNSARNLNEMTVGMTYTGNQDTNWDASDLNVYFDQDFIKPSVYGKLSVALDLMNEDAYDQKLQNPAEDIKFLDGVYIDKMAFTLNGEYFDLAKYIQDLTGEDKASDGEVIRDYADLLKATQDAIAALKAEHPNNAALQSLKAELNGPFFSDISPVDGQLREGTRLVLTVDNNDNAGNTLTVKSGDLTLNRADAATVENNNRYERADKFDPETDSVVETNIHLEKVGRQGDGGTLTVGSMFKDSANKWSDKYAGKGIEKFNVTVTGNEDKTNSLAGLHSTGNNLKHVDLTSAPREDGSYADVTIGNSVTERKAANEAKLGTLAVNANALKDVQTFDATGFKGDLTLYAALTDEVVAKYMNLKDTQGNPADDNVSFTYSGGEGNDYINLAIDTANLGAAGTTTREDFTLSIEGNAGNDTIVVSTQDLENTTVADGNLSVAGNWYQNSKLNANLSVKGGEGDDAVYLNGSGDWKVDLGAGNDVVYAGDSGNFYDNKKAAVWVLNTADQAAPDASERNITDLLSDTNNSFAGILKSKISVSFKQGNGIYTSLDVVVPTDSKLNVTDLMINQAIKEAINSDPVLSKLLSAADGPANTLVITSLIDGAHEEATDLTINWKAPVAKDLSAADVATYNASLSSSGVPATSPADLATKIAAAITAAEAGSFGDDYTAAFGNNGTDGLFGKDSTHVADNTIIGGAGNDVLVLGTGAESNDTVKYIGHNNGTDTIVNFKVGALDTANTGADIVDLKSYEAEFAQAGSYNGAGVWTGTADQLGTLEANLKAGDNFLRYFKNDDGSYTIEEWTTKADGDATTVANIEKLGTIGTLNFGEDVAFTTDNFVIA